jgi:hypothetical protein
MATAPGYNITCDPGDLYSRRCYVNTASGQKQEIIDYTDDGQPISKAPSSASYIAWVPTLTTLNQDGVAYQPYGEAGLPFVAAGGRSSSSPTTDTSGSSSSSSSDEMKGKSKGLGTSVPTLGTALLVVGVSTGVGFLLMKKFGK